MLATYKASQKASIGAVAYADLGSGRFLTGLKLSRLVIADKKPTITGTGVTNSLRSVEFTIELKDLSTNGKTDTSRSAGRLECLRDDGVP